MTGENTKNKVMRYIKTVLIIDIIVMAIAGIICWGKGCTTYVGYSNALMYAGAIFLVIGLFSTVGNFFTRGNFRYQYTSTTGVNQSHERAKDEFKLMLYSHNFFFLVILVGVSLFLLSYLIVKLFAPSI
ncbi:hypothetical protein [Caldisalinibacter kiritimatiensis]|uniref:DUF3899 domain-containing protein n=1 Tax=Caldisalinibacter kiritimatiensis TaxID=1304284 RepID=R1CV41_9FIRM|nr:hypothetical protein [Caldisalinibacter kiritimatiensis]EOD00489.1 hypothetical protein L21TH_1468 [Caldisalinibacter kiritimatiensis]